MSPTARSLDRLRRLGYLADTVERWIAQAGVKRDLFGCIDLVAIKEGEAGVLGVQATSIDHVSHRLEKARALPALAVWLRASNRFEVWGWVKRGPRWEVKVVEVRQGDLPQDLVAVVVQQPKRRRPGSRHVQGDLPWDE